MNHSSLGLKFALGIALTTTMSLGAASAFAGYAPGNDAVSVQSSIAAGDADTDSQCRPPSSSAACAEWHEQIRRNFTVREIGMLFGAATSYPEFRSSYSRLKDRYERLRTDLAIDQQRSADVASR